MRVSSSSPEATGVKNVPVRIAMIAITTSSSMSVKTSAPGHRMLPVLPWDPCGHSEDRHSVGKTSRELMADRYHLGSSARNADRPGVFRERP